LEDSPLALKHALWQATDAAFKSAVERFQRVRTDLKTAVEEESKADDFSREKPSIHSEPAVALALDGEAWAKLIRHVSRLALQYPLIHESSVALVGVANNRSMVTSEGSRVKTGQKHLRVAVSAGTSDWDARHRNGPPIFRCSAQRACANTSTFTGFHHLSLGPGSVARRACSSGR
jgi:hypothetical protein